MCVYLEHPNLMSGWGCCNCRAYNGLWRDSCKQCMNPVCTLDTGKEKLEPRKE